MKQLSNVHGVVGVEGGRVYGWRGDVLIGDFPMPLTRADADLFVEMCLHPTPGDGTYYPGVTGTHFIYQDLMEVPLPPGVYEKLMRDPTGIF